MTQERLAEELGVDVRSVRDWEGGRRAPRTAARLGEICDVLGAPREALALSITTPTQWVRPMLTSSFDAMEIGMDRQGGVWGSSAGGQMLLGRVSPRVAPHIATELDRRRHVDERQTNPGSLENRLAGARLSATTDGVPSDYRLVLPHVGCLAGPSILIQYHQLSHDSDHASTMHVVDSGHPEEFVRSQNRGLVVGVGAYEDEVRHFGLDVRQARAQLAHAEWNTPCIRIPRAYELDDFTYGLVWAAASLDDALLADDVALDEKRHDIGAYEALSGSAVSRRIAADLTPASQMWLGSHFCARHILRNMGRLSGIPVFWTREQRGDETCSWLLFRHKGEYLRRVSSGFGSSAQPLVRNFCVPEHIVQVSARFERVLLFLCIALMESLRIEVRLCAETEYEGVDGFVLSPNQRAIIATWVRSDGLWHVETTTSRPLLRAYGDAVGHAEAHSAIKGTVPLRRLQALAEYLDLEWSWLVRRAQELAKEGCSGLLGPQSRLLSTDALDAACAFVGVAQGRDGS